jgi:very-short-patch-repair endonuclease
MPSPIYLLCIAGLLVTIYFFKRLEMGSKTETTKYAYTTRPSIMSKPEREVYKLLTQAVGESYVVVPQVHLSTMLDHEVKGQNWRGALASIQRKSVDFCICDRTTFAPKLAVELDDRSHLRKDRGVRDSNVEAWLAAAGLPLLRIPNHGSFNAEKIKEEVLQKLS